MTSATTTTKSAAKRAKPKTSPFSFAEDKLLTALADPEAIALEHP